MSALKAIKTMKTPLKTTLLCIFLCFLSFQLFAQNAQEIVNQQDLLIRNQQDQLRQEKLEIEQKNIENERKRLQNLENEQKSSQNDENSQNCFKIDEITVIDANSLSKRQISRLTSPFLQKCLNSNTLTQIIAKIDGFYKKKGLITAQIFIPQQNIQSGKLQIQVIEGLINEISLGNDKIRQKMQRFMAFGDKKGEILNLNDINQGMYQINRLVSNKADMKIVPSEIEGKSNIIIENKATFPASLKLSYDNLGNDFTGIRRSLASTSLENLLSLNDQINLSYATNLDDDSAQKELKSFSGGISIPFTYSLFSFDYSRTEFKGQNQGINGTATLTGYSDRLNYALERVLLNTANNRLATTISLTQKETASYLNKTKIETSERKLSIANFSLTYSKYFKNGANIYLKPTYARGIRLLNAKKDQAGISADTPKAQFQLYKLYASLSKGFAIPKINLPITLTTEFDSQVSKDTLFGSEQFSVGGYYSVRGFRENYIAGDHGYYFRNKARINAENISKHLTQFAVEPFYDYGYAKTKISGDSGRLSGAGLKTIYSGKYFNASLTYSWAISKSKLITSSDKENKMLYFELSAGL
jgi:hemolysin activation/secretion protein